MIVLDASVVIKWFHGVREENRQKAMDFLNRHLSNQLTINVPDLLLYEVANALLNKAHVGQEMTLRAINQLTEYKLQMHWPGAKGIKAATEIAGGLEITIYDAAYVALARELGADLITADKKLARKAGKMYSVLLLEE